MKQIPKPYDDLRCNLVINLETCDRERHPGQESATLPPINSSKDFQDISYAEWTSRIFMDFICHHRQRPCRLKHAAGLLHLLVRLLSEERKSLAVVGELVELPLISRPGNVILWLYSVVRLNHSMNRGYWSI